MILRRIRQKLTDQLWQHYQAQLNQANEINRLLSGQFSTEVVLDHYAIIDLPGPNTGISVLKSLFEALGYDVKGRGYLPDKQNDFLWMAEIGCEQQPVTHVLPQVVLADFRLDALPKPIYKIVSYYANFAPPIPLGTIKTLLTQAARNPLAEQTLIKTLSTYLQNKDWPTPTQTEFETVFQFNELLAWVLVFGRRVNHFAISVHHLEGFEDLSTFNQYIRSNSTLPLYRGGLIKGSSEALLEQSATRAPVVTVPLADGFACIPDRFVEFIWRHFRNTQAPKTKSTIWQDYFVHFLGENADDLIETLYS